MGCVPSKQTPSQAASPSARIVPINASFNKEISSNTFVKTRIIDSIKRGDIVLFEKTMFQYQVKPTEIIGPSDQNKTILHYLAESNFAKGMISVLDYIAQKYPNELRQIVNTQDANGNTPVVTCCIHEAMETLKALIKCGQVDLSLKNEDGKNAKKICEENDSACLHALTAPHTPGSPKSPVTRPTTNSISTSLFVGQSQLLSPKLQIPRRGSLKDKEDEILLSTSRLSEQIRSVTSFAKEEKISPATRLYTLLNELSTKNINFVDEEFPHDIHSVVNEEEEDEYINSYKKLKWLRPFDFLTPDLKKLKVFESIDLNHVAKRPLAGCELYSALAALTEYPQKLLSLFVNKEANKQGVYSLNFLVSGIPVEILLDDYFPCFENSEPIFSRPQANELWFLLIEKAFAKLYGSYHDIKEVTLADAFEIMTGMPTSQHSLKETKEDSLWNTLVEADKRNYIVCAGVDRKDDSDSDNSNRYFTITRICETEEYRVIKLKSHFEDFPWKGDFAYHSTKWSKELQEQAGYCEDEKNCFYMEVKEFMTQFDYLSVCHYHENWVRSNLEITCSSKKATFYEINVEKEMEVFISVHQKLPRFVEESENYDISPVEILVAEELEGGVLRKVAAGEKDAFVGKHTVYADDKFKVKLSEGKYIIRTKVRWVDEGRHDITLSTYSPCQLNLRKVKRKSYPGFLEKVYLEAGLHSTERYQLSNRCEFASSWCGSHLWLYGINKGTKTWNLEINFNKLENLQLCKKYRTSENILKLVIPPKAEAVAFAKRINSHAVELNWNFNQSWE